MGKVTLYFTREFTRGRLKGCRHNDTISFVGDSFTSACAAAKSWVEMVNRQAARGKIDYKVVDKSFQKYWRD